MDNVQNDAPHGHDHNEIHDLDIELFGERLPEVDAESNTQGRPETAHSNLGSDPAEFALWHEISKLLAPDGEETWEPFYPGQEKMTPEEDAAFSLLKMAKALKLFVSCMGNNQ
jgi:hypothetical protein